MKMTSKTENDLKHLDDLNNEDEPKNENDTKKDDYACARVQKRQDL